MLGGMVYLQGSVSCEGRTREGKTLTASRHLYSLSEVQTAQANILAALSISLADVEEALNPTSSTIAQAASTAWSGHETTSPGMIGYAAR
jgi:hypothetical protein